MKKIAYTILVLASFIGSQFAVAACTFNCDHHSPKKEIQAKSEKAHSDCHGKTESIESELNSDSDTENCTCDHTVKDSGPLYSQISVFNDLRPVDSYYKILFSKNLLKNRSDKVSFTSIRLSGFIPPPGSLRVHLYLGRLII